MNVLCKKEKEHPEIFHREKKNETFKAQKFPFLWKPILKEKGPNDKVRDHCHIPERNCRAAHTYCNLNVKPNIS